MRTILLILGSVLILCGCGSNAVAPQLLAEFNILAPDLSAERYRIGVGDKLSINVWGNPELTLIVPVRPDGYISIPLIGDVAASGMDTETLAAHVTDLLDVQLRNPQVSIIVAEINNSLYLSRVRVTGAVENPMSIPYSRGMSVLDAVLEAGGINELASANRAKLYRTTDDALIEVEVRLGDILLRGRLDTNFSLRPGDVITVPERMF